MKTVSVVIPTLNEEQNIAGLINALVQQNTPIKEIIVVDGGSNDQTANIAAGYSEVRLLASQPPVGAQRQLGLEKASGEIVVLMDADTIPPSDFISKCLKEMDARCLDVACRWYKPHPSNALISLVYGFLNIVFYVTQKVLASGAGSCIIVKRTFALQIGGFCRHLVYEDIEFIRRASRRGRFGVMRTPILVSDRRFREFGIVSMAIKYLILSVFFSLGLFRQANIVRYPFGKYRRHG